MSKLPHLFDHRRLPVKLGKRIGAGGEGAVYALHGEAGRVAKVYHQALKPPQVEKLHATVAAGNDVLRKLCAWPEKLLQDPIGAVWGFVMPKVDGYRELHMLYAPGDRRAHFEHGGLDFLVAAARNLAAAVGRVHEYGHVIGDLNQRNVLVNAQALIALIDIDSLQIRAPDGRVYRCLVGTPHLTAPELHGGDYGHTDRSPEHDRFALAVLIFHLLMMGRHPHAGVWNGDDDMSIERAIREGRYVYALQADRRFGMEPPRQAPPIAIVGPLLAALFERAFCGAPAQRPDAATWLQALESFRTGLKVCALEPRHRFHGGQPRCPWCELEEQGTYFFAPSPAQVTQRFDPEQVRRDLALVPAPSFEAVQMPPVQVLKADPRQVDIGVIRLKMGMVGGMGALLVAVLLTTFLWWLGLAAAGLLAWWLKLQWQHWRDARELLDCALSRAEQRLSDGADAAAPELYRQRFEQLRLQLQAGTDRLDALRQQARVALAELKVRNRELQLEAFLRGFPIRAAGLPGLTPDRLLKLAAHGIDTAAEVEAAAITAIRGIGITSASQLVEWRRTLEAGFSFDPRCGPPKLELDRLHARFHRREAELLLELRAAPATLRRFGEQCRRDQQRAKAALVQLSREREQAHANARA